MTHYLAEGGLPIVIMDGAAAAPALALLAADLVSSFVNADRARIALRTIAEKLLTYALGRDVNYLDAPAV